MISLLFTCTEGKTNNRIISSDKSKPKTQMRKRGEGKNLMGSLGIAKLFVHFKRYYN